MTNHNRQRYGRRMAALAVFACSAFAQPEAPTQELPVSPAAAQAGDVPESARAAHLKRLVERQAEFGLDAEHTFRVIHSRRDDLGWTHVRMQQYFGGIRVVHGTAISHASPTGVFSYTDSLKPRINVSLLPALRVEEALAIAARQPSHTAPYPAPPAAELVIYPVTDAAQPVTPAAAPAEPDPALFRRVVKEYRLAYEIRAAEAQAGSGPGSDPWVYYIDSRNGEVLDSKSLVKRSVGTGMGKFNKNVMFITSSGGGWYQLVDEGRNYSTWDADTFVNASPNVDQDNHWGDGAPFAGDGIASGANRQTAMVDGHFGGLVFWELMNNVFGRRGPDGKNGHINIYAHWGTNWDDAAFSPPNSIQLGDGPNRQAPDCLGHELGHALNHNTAQLDGLEADGLNESNSDIWGALTTFYLGGGGYAARSHTIPKSGGSWRSGCSNRDMIKPSSTGGAADYWYPGLYQLPDVHRRGEPNNRAFHFLAEGASPIMTDDSYSEYLPFGMIGVGIQTAAQIWFDALNWMPSDADYEKVMGACVTAAVLRYGLGSMQVAAVQNAYAGIGVGARAASYGAISVGHEFEPNDFFGAATLMPIPQQRLVFDGSGKIVLVRASLVQGLATGDADWYKILVPSGTKLRAGVLPRLSFWPEIYYLQVYDQYLIQRGSSLGLSAVFQPVEITAGSGPTYLKVSRIGGLGLGMYELSAQY